MVTDPTHVALVTISVGGRPLSTEGHDALVDVRVEQSLHVPDQVTLRFIDRNFKLADANTFPIGSALDVSVDVGGGAATIAKAEITQVTFELDGFDRAELAVVALDRGHRLAHGAKVRTYTQSSDAQVVRTVAGMHGLTAKCTGNGLTHEYLLQHATDYAFVSERATALGYDWWVDDNTLHFEPRKSTGARPVLSWGDNLRSFRVRVSAAETAASVTVRGWDPVNQQAVTATRPLPGLSPSEGIGTNAAFATSLVAAAKKSAPFKEKRLAASAQVATSREADALASSLATSAAAEQVTARGEAVGNPALKPGVEVDLRDVGGRLSGRYLLTTVEHVIGAGRPYVTRFESGGRQPRTLVDLLGDGVAGAPAMSLAPGNLVVGVVTNNNDPNRLGRVKVKYPSLSNEDESAWARVVSVGAGKSRGLQVLPDVGDEVLVGFEHADARRPLILGGLWSSKNARPDHKSTASKGGAVWQTRAGHLLEMSDGSSPDQRFVTIALSDGKTSLRLGEDAAALKTPNALSMTADKGGELIVKGQLKIQADSITIAAAQRLVLEGRSGVEIRGGTGPVRIRGINLDASGTSTTTIGSPAGITDVKGSILKLN